MKRLFPSSFLVTACLAGLLLPTGQQTKEQNQRPLIIDMHLHADTLSGFLGDMEGAAKVCTGDQDVTYPGWDPQKPLTVEAAQSCARPLAAPATDKQLLNETLQMLERYNIRAVTSGSLNNLATWRTAAPDRIIPAVNFKRGRDGQGRPLYRSPEELRRLYAEGKFAIFAEVGRQYDGIGPGDPVLKPYFALAEELDIPVGLHMGEGPPGGAHVGYRSQYRVAAGRPLLLEDVLVRHPRLRIYVMHFGSPFVDEMIALLYSHPQVYVDVAQNNWGFPRKHFHNQLRRLVEAGFGKRILFGSDQMIWPQTIKIAIETIESADFLTHEQKRDILCRNAARFLRLDHKVCD